MHRLTKLGFPLTAVDVITAISGSLATRPQARLAQLAEAVCDRTPRNLLGQMAHDYPSVVINWNPVWRRNGEYEAWLFDDGSMLEITSSGINIYQF